MTTGSGQRDKDSKQGYVWRHDDEAGAWKFGYQDIDRNLFFTLYKIADETIDLAVSKGAIALAVERQIGTVPPPLEEFLSERNIGGEDA